MNFPTYRFFKACTFTLILLLISHQYGYSSNTYDLRFKTGNVQVSPNLEAFILNPSIQQNELYNGKFFRIIQFQTLPSASNRLSLENAGIKLTGYFPDNAYFAIINQNADLNLLRSAGVRAVVTFNPLWKVSSQLNQNNLPIWALNEKGKIDLVVKYFSGLSGDDIVASFIAKGYSILRRYDYGSWVEVRIPESKIMEIASLSFVTGVDAIAAPSTPDDEKGRSLHRSSTINTYSPMGRHYDGTGVSVALADDGPVGPHIDYTGRIDQTNTTTNNGTHGDMTTGICMGAGNLNPTIRGMGTGAFIYIYDIGGYNHILNSPTTNQTLGVLVTSTSYSQGCNEYTTDTQTGDQILNENPTLLHVYSAGNNGTGNCTYGAGAGWGNITGGYKQGKNVISCGNLNYLDALEASSSRGPAADGRIKPDICANGIDQMSTNGPNTYQVGGGTSAACPGIAGIVTQLHQAFRDLNGGQTAEGALIKACMLNTAEDLGNPGPDFRHGWGRVNALRAVKTLEEVRYISDNISQGITNTHNINIPSGTQQLRVMLYWNDVEGDPLAVKALVNDLNFSVSDPSSTIVLPWVLDPTPNPVNLNANAIHGVDDLNNMEQVTIDLPAAGNYTLSVDGFNIPQGPQKYYIVYEFVTDVVTVTYPIGYEGFVPGETETLRWDAFGTSGTFSVEYSTNNGSSWNVISGNVPATQRYYNWVVPATLTGTALIRVTRGSQSGQSPETFSIIGLPSNISVDWACPDSIRLVWNGVSGAIGYEVSVLGNMYMDSLTYTTNTSAILTGINPNLSYWFSVRAYTPDNTKGRRANAINKTPGVFSCPIMIDASITELISPKGNLQNCQDLSAITVSISVENKGMNPISNIPVFYSINNGPPVSEIITNTLNSFTSTIYNFTATYDFSVIGVYDVKVWTDYVADGNHYNDTAQAVLEVEPGTLVTLPYSENFETFFACGTANDCELGGCGLYNGWKNLANNIADQIDWRTNAGATPSANTGPDIDHSPGTAVGKYLYLEASVCFQREAIAVSPCIDLTTATMPQMEFWYHMYGAAMGELHVDIFANDVWTNDIMPVLIGNQGNSWQQAAVDLTPFTGQIVNIRFRGMTGNDFTSDMAIDDFNVYELSAPPVTNFTASATNICAGQTITLIDLSLNSPATWDWVISPATGYTFVNGTTANSQNPEVQFTLIGNYDVALTTSNVFGSSNVTVNSYISVGSGSVTPLIEPFQNVQFPPINWVVENFDSGITWTQSGSIIGSGGIATTSAYIDNFAYNAAGQEDGLVTERVDLTNTLNPIMTFDVSHARYSAAFEDALRIDISTDCGVTYFPTGYYKIGVNLATVPDQNALFSPVAANQWRNDTIDLAGFVGSEVNVKFVNITGYGNSLFIDNVNFKESSVGIQEANQSGFFVHAFPNPGNGIYSIAMNTAQSTDMKIKVTDLKGAEIFSTDLKVAAGKTLYPLDISTYGKGIYLLNVQSEAGSRIIKLVVM